MNDARAKAEAWLAGWRCGATFSVIPDHYQQNPDFTAGWHAGRAASKVARGQAEAQYGIVFGTIHPL